jgi:hypothetical protein
MEQNSQDFPAACRALLGEVLSSAGILVSETQEFESSFPRIRLIDLGFGCGDQTLHLAQLHRSVRKKLHVASHPVTLPLFDDYVGVTLEKKQFDVAQHRVQSLNDSRINLFCADAAKPESWCEKLHTATIPRNSPTLVSKPTETWLLSLDTLYHFSPSREAIFKHAHNSLNANIMAFDLLLADEGPGKYPTRTQNLILSLIAAGSGTPRGNFLTKSQYVAQLVAAGYAAEDVSIRDVSDQVFIGLAKFLHEHDGRLRGMGLGGIGAFHVAKWVFAWWARTGIIRGCIVVAKTRKAP